MNNSLESPNLYFEIDNSSPYCTRFNEVDDLFNLSVDFELMSGSDLSTLLAEYPSNSYYRCSEFVILFHVDQIEKKSEEILSLLQNSNIKTYKVKEKDPQFYEILDCYYPWISVGAFYDRLRVETSGMSILKFKANKVNGNTAISKVVRHCKNVAAELLVKKYGGSRWMYQVDLINTKEGRSEFFKSMTKIIKTKKVFFKPMENVISPSEEQLEYVIKNYPDLKLK